MDTNTQQVQAILGALPKKLRANVEKQLKKTIDESALNGCLLALKKATAGVDTLMAAHDFDAFARAYLKRKGARITGGSPTKAPDLTDEEKATIRAKLKEKIKGKKNKEREKTAMDISREMMLAYKKVNDYVKGLKASAAQPSRSK